MYDLDKLNLDDIHKYWSNRTFEIKKGNNII